VVNAAFGFSIATPEGVPTANPANIRLMPERGGGALLDAGTYAMSFVRLAVGERPLRALATAKFTQTGVDQTVAATLVFPGGAIGQITCSLSTAAHRHATIIAERGIVETSFSNHAVDGKLALRVKNGIPNTVPFETIEVPGGDGFLAEADSFAQLVRGAGAWNGASIAESVDTVLALEAIAASTRSGGWVEIPS
jgi:predicted dehydrogenase